MGCDSKTATIRIAINSKMEEKRPVVASVRKVVEISQKDMAISACHGIGSVKGWILCWTEKRASEISCKTHFISNKEIYLYFG